MADQQLLAEAFEEHRAHLRGVAYRMLGSLSEAEDAVQEAWLRLMRLDGGEIGNLGGWLTTVVSRVCLDALRSRKARREEAIDVDVEPAIVDDARDPESEAVLADSVGLALLVVLDTLDPPERLAFVLHDMFGIPFDEIAAIVGRTPAAARQLASRARRRVRGASVRGDRAGQRPVVDAFLAAVRRGDLEGLLAVLDPDVEVRVDAGAGAGGRARVVHGAATWARQAIAFARGLGAVQPAVVDGSVGLILAPQGRLTSALRFTFADGKIVEVDVIADPARLRALDVAPLEVPPQPR